jgi:hypothetical protein
MRKITVGLGIIFLFVFACTNSSAQVITNYAFAPTSGTFTALSGATNANISQDEYVSDAINIGFDFWYMGNRYTQVYASSNGFISF